MAVDTMGSLLALLVTAGNVDDREAVFELCDAVQTLTGEAVAVAFVDQGYTGENAQDDANWSGIELVVVSKPEVVKGFVLLPKRWVRLKPVRCWGKSQEGGAFAWVTQFRRLARDFERLPQVFAGLHFLVFGILMLAKFLRGVGLPPV
jgi:transposase